MESRMESIAIAIWKSEEMIECKHATYELHKTKDKRFDKNVFHAIFFSIVLNNDKKKQILNVSVILQLRINTNAKWSCEFKLQSKFGRKFIVNQSNRK